MAEWEDITQFIVLRLKIKVELKKINSTISANRVCENLIIKYSSLNGIYEK